MNYEEKYKEALERSRRLHDRMLVLSSTDALVASAELEFIFPELAGSEDERIRKELKEAFEAYDIESSWNGIPIRSIFAWLEKQKEPKHATDSKSERVIKAARSVLNNWLDGTDCPDVSGDFAELEYAIREYDGDDKQKEQKKKNVLIWGEPQVTITVQKQEWSEEDEKRVKQLIYDTEHIRAEYEKRKKELGESFNDELIKDCDEQIAWLKSLRPSWKPSEEQMKALEHALISCEEEWAYQDDELRSLFDDLKKL